MYLKNKMYQDDSPLYEILCWSKFFLNSLVLHVYLFLLM